jgi:hypothetical protein
MLDGVDQIFYKNPNLFDPCHPLNIVYRLLQLVKALSKLNYFLSSNQQL